MQFRYPDFPRRASSSDTTFASSGGAPNPASATARFLSAGVTRR